MHPATVPSMPMHTHAHGYLTPPVIGVIAFLTVVDLFATQAILPALAVAYKVSPASMGLAVNACTLGMAVAGLACAFLPDQLNRRLWIAGALALLAVPTVALAGMPPLPVFALLRICQGLCMATAFALTLAYLGEACSTRAAAGAFAAFIAGNVASNLVGRIIAAGVTDAIGLPANFALFAALNLGGALLVLLVLRHRPPMAPHVAHAPASVWRAHLGNPALRNLFFIGFCILFVFLGVFTFIGFVLTRAPFALRPMLLGAVYLVFAPAIFTTGLSGHVVRWLGRAWALLAGLALAMAGLPLLLASQLPVFLTGLVLVSVGTFFAQAVATGAVSETAMGQRTAASGMYLGAYYLGGLVGTAVLGQVFDSFGWPATVGCLALALLSAACAAIRLPRRPVMSHH